MLNQFYNYLSDKIIEYYKCLERKVGEKYFIQLDEESHVENLYEALRDSGHAEEFSYKHEKGDEYKTFALNINGVKYVVAASNKVTEGYLVTLRNAISAQESQCMDTSLLILFHNTLDSINNGSCDLQKKGMPLNIKSLSENLVEEINKSKLSNIDKQVLEFYLKKKLDENIACTSIWDYEEVLGLIRKEKIEDIDYKSIGLFFDKNLETITGKAAIKKRLEENYNFFDKVRNSHGYEDIEKQLEKTFDEKGINKLKKDNWETVDYANVKKSHDNSGAKDKALIYEGLNNKGLNGYSYYEREDGTTASGQRKRHIVVFADKDTEEINLEYKFNESLREEYIQKNSKNIARTSGKKLIICLPINEDVTFKQVVYTHKKQSKSKFIYNILILRCNDSFFKTIQTKYSVDCKKKLLSLKETSTEVKLGDYNNENIVKIQNQGEIVKFNEGKSILVSSNLDTDDENLKFTLKVDNLNLNIQVIEDSAKPMPVQPIRILREKREKKESFIRIGNKLVQNTNEFYIESNFNKYLNLEREIVEKEILYGELLHDGIDRNEIIIPQELRKIYLKILNYYKERNIIPTLTYINDELESLYKEFLEIFCREIESIKEREILSDQGHKKDLLKLGTLYRENELYLTPFAPINIAYQLKVKDELQAEILDNNILERLTPNNLLPYLYDNEDKLLRPIDNKDALEWITYQRSEKVSVGTTNKFIANLVKEKIEQFIKHFNYLFMGEKSLAPIKINVINVKNDIEIVKGVFNFVKSQIEKNNIVPVHINLYDSLEECKFDKFFNSDSIDYLEGEFGISFKAKNLDKVDILRLVQENIKYYKINKYKELEYSHISFYKVGFEDKNVEDNMEEIETGLSINGLLSTTTSVNNKSSYRTGFGSKNILNKEDLLVRTSININELAANSEKGGDRPYTKGVTIVTKPGGIKTVESIGLYEKSHWVTFIEPSFGLEYFQKEHSKVMIIHYSEQYTSSDQYDTITVTNKSKQYKEVIKEFLLSKEIVINDEKIDSTIKMFNSINGEWLLNIITKNDEYEREKLSIISAIKYGMVILDHKDILWIPLSLEEILRIAGAIKLDKTEGIFSVKTLKAKGVHSDDVLFIGVSFKEGEGIKLHYYPIEVKVGLNKNSVINKGNNQIDKTYDLIRKQLYDNTFKSKFYRNFFIQLLLANTHKLIVNEIWDEKCLNKILTLKSYLMNDEYTISLDMITDIGKGALISFKKDNSWRSITISDDKLFIELTEEDAYKGISKTIHEIDENLIREKTDIDLDKLIRNKEIIYEAVEELEEEYINLEEDDEAEELQESSENSNIVTQVDDIQGGNNFDIPAEIINDDTEKFKGIITKEIKAVKVEDTRALIGTARGSVKKIYWEYGNKNLGNRHMLISGKSGQGKTYFIQCLMKELSEQGIPSLIIDYTNGFKLSMMESEFKDALGDKLEQVIVMKDKISVNPFKRNKIVLDEDIIIDETDYDIAERVKSVIGAVYSDLGSQQLNSIYQATIKSLEKYGDNINLRILRDELEEDTTTYAKTALSQLSLLIDKNPFDSTSNFSWDKLDSGKGNVLIIQLTGFTTDVQRIITEMILWDLWYYKVQHGNKNKPFAVILDEAQNLDFGENSPCTKILNEGRKYGWSAWFATQFLKGQMKADVISRLQNASQKIYFAPPEEAVSSIANGFTIDREERKQWEKELLELRKGQCISYGPILGQSGALDSDKPVVVDITSLGNR